MSKFPTRNLTEEQARECAVMAARILKKEHAAYQLRNGRWKWARLTWPTALSLMLGAAIRYQVFGKGGEALQGKCYAKI